MISKSPDLFCFSLQWWSLNSPWVDKTGVEYYPILISNFNKNEEIALLNWANSILLPKDMEFISYYEYLDPLYCERLGIVDNIFYMKFENYIVYASQDILWNLDQFLWNLYSQTHRFYETVTIGLSYDELNKICNESNYKIITDEFTDNRYGISVDNRELLIELILKSNR